MANEAEQLVQSFLKRLQKSRVARRVIAAAAVLALLGVAGQFLYDLLPRQYRLTITGGDLLGNRHLVAKVLEEEGAANGLSLRILPSAGSVEALEAVDAGKLDLAFVQGGLSADYPNVVHVATISPELIHFLVRPGITTVQDLVGKVVNLGSKGGGTRVVAKEILRFSGLNEGAEYAESNWSNEQLIAMRADRLPDAIVVVSYAPSFVADFLVKQRGYRLLEMPFPASLALRLGWVADTSILAYTYSITPAVPERDVKVIGVNLHLVANRNVDPHAVLKVLETLYSPQVESRVRQHFDETSQLTLPSGFELSQGTQMFMARNDPLLSAKTWDRLKDAFGLVMSALSTALVIFKWFKGEAPATVSPDIAFRRHLTALAEIDLRLAELAAEGGGSPAEMDELAIRLATLRGEAAREAAQVKLDDSSLVPTLFIGLADARGQLDALRGRVLVG